LEFGAVLTTIPAQVDTESSWPFSPTVPRIPIHT